MERVEAQHNEKHQDNPDDQKHLVSVTVDGTIRQVPKGKYQVSEFKATVGVAPEYELDQIEDGQFAALADDATIHIKEGEVFVSHVRRGGSS